LFTAKSVANITVLDTYTALIKLCKHKLSA